MTPKQLKAKRLSHGLTQAQLALQLGVHSVTVCRWEKGVYAIPKHIEIIDWRKL